jgi:hypothetical protein
MDWTDFTFSTTSFDSKPRLVTTLCLIGIGERDRAAQPAAGHPVHRHNHRYPFAHRLAASVIGRPKSVTGAPATSSPAQLREARLAQMKKYNIVREVLNGLPSTLQLWVEASRKSFVAGPMIVKDDAPRVECR